MNFKIFNINEYESFRWAITPAVVNAYNYNSMNAFCEFFQNIIERFLIN